MKFLPGIVLRTCCRNQLVKSRKLICSVYLFFSIFILSISTLAFAKSEAFHPYLTAQQFSHASKPRLAKVILDPGHGGRDPGATGPHGTHEKNVVLAIAKDMHAMLRRYAGIHVIMTRNTDRYVTLYGRLQVAWRNHADLFMSIHADAFYNHRAKGSSVFALAKHDATNEAARWIAGSENHAFIGGAKFNHRKRSIQSVLLNLSQAATIKASLAYGADVIHQLKGVTVMHSDHVDQGPFEVLRSPDIPSLLVETGFISNAEQERELAIPSFQRKIAYSLSRGIVTYIYRHPPHSTIISRQQAGELSISVRKGETLSSIAHAYNDTVWQLRHENHLRGNKVVVGRLLKIPAAKT